GRGDCRPGAARGITELRQAGTSLSFRARATPIAAGIRRTVRYDSRSDRRGPRHQPIHPFGRRTRLANLLARNRKGQERRKVETTTEGSPPAAQGIVFRSLLE